MFRRISTKWVLSVLAIGILPFLAFAWFTNVQMGNRLWDVVRYYLQSIAADLSEKVDDEIRERRLDIEQWAEDSMIEWTVDERGDPSLAARTISRLDVFVSSSFVYDLILVVDDDGRYVVSNTSDYDGEPFSNPRLADLESFDYSQTAWFQRARKGSVALIDQHVSTLVPPRAPSIEHSPENYHFGFAVPVFQHDERGQPTTGEENVVGVVLGLVNWGYIQADLLKPERGAYFQGLKGADIYSSSYAWLWKSDGDTILGHIRPELYGKKVSEPPVSLPQLVEACRAAKWGMYPEYTFGGEKKNAAFRHCAGVDAGGFGWIVGIGIDNKDIYKTVYDLRSLLLRATLVVLGGVTLWTIWMARRTTRPIVELESYTRRVAAGDLDARIEVRSEDELGQLARAFNEMTAELEQSRAQAVQIEKEAAWREMARQVAHEIKNPLTPIQLSTNLLLRARRENSPEFDGILERTAEMITRQVESMREIASDFAAFAGVRKVELEDVNLVELTIEILDLTSAWAEELNVTVIRSATLREGATAHVRADRGELRRVLLNLVNNALEAMPDGGELNVDVQSATKTERVIIVICDTGEGLSEEARARLFEPYFTTRSRGTGLGLAICKRVIDELGGTITLEPAASGSGTRVRIEMPAGTSQGAA